MNSGLSVYDVVPPQRTEFAKVVWVDVIVNWSLLPTQVDFLCKSCCVARWAGRQYFESCVKIRKLRAMLRRSLCECHSKMKNKNN